MLKRRALSVFRRAVENFKRPKKREDSSDLDDFLTESIAAMQAIIFEILARRRRQKLQKTFEKLRKKSATLSDESAKWWNMTLPVIRLFSPYDPADGWSR